MNVLHNPISVIIKNIIRVLRHNSIHLPILFTFLAVFQHNHNLSTQKKSVLIIHL